MAYQSSESFKMVPKFDELRNNLSLLRKTFPAAAKAIATEFAAESVSAGKTQGIIPRKTGNLRSTARVEVRDNSVFFVTGGIIGKPSRRGQKAIYVNYAYYVNNGTSKQTPQFFMERSVSAAAIKQDTISRKILASWLSRIK